MSNPARDLANLIEPWITVPPNRSISSSRGGDAGMTWNAYWETQYLAVQLLGEVSRYLDDLSVDDPETADAYRSYLPVWFHGVFAPSRKWDDSPSGTVRLMQDRELQSLRTLAGHIDQRQRPSFVPPQGRTTSATALDDLVDAVDNGLIHMGPSERRYFDRLVAEVRALLVADSGQADTDLIGRLNELYGFIRRFLDELEPDDVDVIRLEEVAKSLLPYSLQAGRVVGWTAEFFANLRGLGA